MDERRRFILTILIGLVILFFLFTRFCLPLARNTAAMRTEFKELQAQVEVLGEFGKEELDFLESRMDVVIAELEQKFPRKGKLNLVEQLTSTPEGSEIIFKALTHKEPQDRKNFRVFPVDVSMEGSFHDIIEYLAGMETSTLLIGIESLSLRRLQPGQDNLEVEVAFSGFRITQRVPTLDTYLDKSYTPLNKRYLEELFAPVEPRGTEMAVATLKDYNPFIFGFGQAEEIIAGLEREPAKIGGFTLNGIMRIGEERVAMINETVVKVGEEIEGMKVLKIYDYEVVLRRFGKDYILKMGVGDEFLRP